MCVDLGYYFYRYELHLTFDGVLRRLFLRCFSCSDSSKKIRGGMAATIYHLPCMSIDNDNTSVYRNSTALLRFSRPRRNSTSCTAKFKQCGIDSKIKPADVTLVFDISVKMRHVTRIMESISTKYDVMGRNGMDGHMDGQHHCVMRPPQKDGRIINHV